MFFRYSVKSPFWSQLMFGLVAFLAFPQFVAASISQPKENTVNQCALVQQEEKHCEECASIFFITQAHFPQVSQQAVISCKIFHINYRLESYFLPENRAGPVSASFV